MKMISTFRTNKSFIYRAMDENGQKLGKQKIEEGTIVTTIDSEYRRGSLYVKLDHNIGWIGSNNPIWNKLDLVHTSFINEKDEIDNDLIMER